jgi:hypothetical protein
MKHIRTYQVFESSSKPEEIKRYLEDILLELSDIGFETDVRVRVNGYATYKSPSDVYYIDIRNNEKFTWFDIEDVISSIDGYLETIDFKRFDYIVHQNIRHCQKESSYHAVIPEFEYKYSTHVTKKYFEKK